MLLNTKHQVPYFLRLESFIPVSTKNEFSAQFIELCQSNNGKILFDPGPKRCTKQRSTTTHHVNVQKETPMFE